MSQINQITPQEPPVNNEPKKNNSIIYWVVILILLAGCIYLFMSKNEMAAKNAAEQELSQQQIDSLNTEQALLKADFEAASAKIDQLVSENAQLDSLLNSQKEAMNKLQRRIRVILNKENITKTELEEAKIMIINLTDRSKEYEERIAELEKQNRILTGKNKVLTRERDSTVSQNIAIRRLASVLHASNIKLEAIKIKRNGKQKETQKARKADVLRVTFDIDENRIAESGTKTVQLRILTPGGNVMNNPVKGSGMMTTAQGDHLSYTIAKAVPLTFNQPLRNIIVDWQQDGAYEKGVYKIEIYNDGYEIGSGDVTLK